LIVVIVNFKITEFCCDEKQNTFLDIFSPIAPVCEEMIALDKVDPQG
jgi:hypothetical protein